MMAPQESNKTLPLVSDWPEWKWFNSIEELFAVVTQTAQANDTYSKYALFPLLDSTAESVDTLRTLIERQKLRDSYVVARVIYETSLNACFLLTDPETLSARAGVHAKQKAMRSLVRAIELAGEKIFEFKVRGADDILGDPEHQKLLQEFTSRSGREITSWTPENLQQRLEAINLKFGVKRTRGLAFGLLLYRHASEIAHGTLYGTLFSWGAMDLPRPLTGPDGIGRFRQRELRHLLKLVSFSLESVIQVVGSALGTEDICSSAGDARRRYFEEKEAIS